MDIDIRNIDKKKIIIIFIAVLIIALIVFLILTGGEDEPEKVAEEPEEIEQQQEIVELPPVSPEEAKKANLLVIAASFIERFGSYSNQGEYANIGDLSSFMTPSFRNWSETSYIDKLKAENPDPSVYFGISTKAISYSFNIYDDEAGRASVDITTQRRRATETMANEEIFYQNAKVDFEKVSGEWKVDAVWWQ